MSVLSWNTIRARAARFAKEWAAAAYEKGQTHLFYQEFFQLFGTPLRRFASFETPVARLGKKRGYIDLFWKGVLLVEKKSAGRDLRRAREQAFDYFPGLADEELPRYILLSDFQRFELLDLETGTEIHFTLPELPQYVEHFAFIRGDEMLDLATQQAVNIRAAELAGRLHDLLHAGNYGSEDLQILLVRLVFCLFADSTGIFDSHQRQRPFAHLINHRSAADGRDLGRLLMELFEILNTPLAVRQTALDEELAPFPYVNGALFADTIRTPAFDSAMRQALLDACAFNWRAVSPAIFGSLFQSVMDGRQRRASGAHYTGEAHILRLIKPLFLDALDAELDRICTMKQKGRRIEALHALHDQIAALNFFDPACGCGNFLVVAYQRLRALETALLKTLYGDGQLQFDTRLFQRSRVNVHQFYGIEIDPLGARIAQAALWMTDHLCNLELGETFGAHYHRIPLTTAPHIHCADALQTGWQDILPAGQCSYVMGNPPFIGKAFQNTQQSAQIKSIATAAGLKSGLGTLDYVCAWWIKAMQYVRHAANPPLVAFVSTSSITQGEQVAQLWPLLLDACRMEIFFAHHPFAWESEARGAAHVHVVIVGLCAQGSAPGEKRLFDYPDIRQDPLETRVPCISPYLVNAAELPDPHIVVHAQKHSLMGYPDLIMGTKPVVDGYYIFTEEQKEAFLQKEPGAAPFMRPYIGSREFINGTRRWILALHQADPRQLRTLPQVLRRMEAVKKHRLSSKKAPTRELAQRPEIFECHVIPEKPFLAIPETSSEKRDYVPIGWLAPPTIPSNSIRLMENAALWHFAILTSRMHMAWLRQFAGRLKSDYRYSCGVVYNTFPWPEGLQTDTHAQEKLNALAQAVLDARAQYPTAALADLYEPLTMPTPLRQAHKTLDRAVERLYRQEAFASDGARVACLLVRYAALINYKKIADSTNE